MIKQALGRRAAQHAPVKAGCVGRMNKAIGLMTGIRANRPVPAQGAEILAKFDIDVLVAATGWARLTARDAPAGKTIAHDPATLSDRTMA